MTRSALSRQNALANQENLSDNIYVMRPSSLAPRKLAPKKVAPARTPYMAHAVQAKDSLSGTPLLSLSPHFPQSTLKLVFSSQIHNGSSQGTAIELSGELIACVAR